MCFSSLPLRLLTSLMFRLAIVHASLAHDLSLIHIWLEGYDPLPFDEKIPVAI